MWKKRQDHCSDERLLAHLDGELGRRDAEDVARHLGECWSCRARSEELNKEALHLARVMNDCQVSGPARVAELKSEFLTWRQRYEANQIERRPVRKIWWMAPLAAGAAAAAALVILGGLRNRTPEALPTIRAAQAAEAQVNVLREPAHQVIRVSITQTRPFRSRTEGRIEIWSDAPGSRFAEKWTVGEGELRQAVWSASPRDAWEYQAGRVAPVRPASAVPVAFADLSSGESSQIEELFLRWLRSRPWRTISLSDCFAEFASGNEVRLRVSTEGAGVVRLVAERTMDDFKVVLTFDVAATDRRPRLLTARYVSPRREFELRLVPERLENVPAKYLRAAMFEPGRELLPPRYISPLRTPATRTGVPAVLQPRTPLLEEHRMEILYALHRAGACSNEIVEFRQEHDGRYRVRLVAASQQRRESLLTKIEALDATLRLDVEVGRLPGPRPARPAGSAVSQAASEAWDAAYLEGLALVQLANLQSRLGDLTERDRSLLKEMIRDHERNMRIQLDRAKAELARGWLELPALAQSWPLEAPLDNWQAVVAEQFRAMDKVDDCLRDLSAASRREGPSSAEASAQLAAAWTAMESVIARVESMAAKR